MRLKPSKQMCFNKNITFWRGVFLLCFFRLNKLKMNDDLLKIDIYKSCDKCYKSIIFQQNMEIL